MKKYIKSFVFIFAIIIFIGYTRTLFAVCIDWWDIHYKIVDFYEKSDYVFLAFGKYTDINWDKGPIPESEISSRGVEKMDFYGEIKDGNIPIDNASIYYPDLRPIWIYKIKLNNQNKEDINNIISDLSVLQTQSHALTNKDKYNGITASIENKIFLKFSDLIQRYNGEVIYSSLPSTFSKECSGGSRKYENVNLFSNGAQADEFFNRKVDNNNFFTKIIENNRTLIIIKALSVLIISLIMIAVLIKIKNHKK